MKRSVEICNRVLFQEARGAPEQVLNNLNRSLEQERKPHTDSTQPSTNTLPSPAKHIYSATGEIPRTLSRTSFYLDESLIIYMIHDVTNIVIIGILV